MNRKVLVIDNYDSFVYNLVHLIAELTNQDPVVLRNDRVDVEEASGFDNILISPGPGIPEEAGNMPEILRELAPSKNILGVCLGHQAIGECFGGKLHNMEDVCHGKGLETHVTDPSALLFKNLPERFVSARYHSWVVSKENFPQDLTVTATDKSGLIMGVQHKQYNVHGIQFHPESVLTDTGHQIMSNWLRL